MDKNVDMGINLYEFNKVNMAKMPILKTGSELRRVKQTIKSFVEEKASTYFMLLNHELRYFTLFNFKNGLLTDIKENAMAKDVIECVESMELGLIDIFPDDGNGALEIWAKDTEEDIAHMFLLFPYNEGVLEY